jgi:DNA helicase-2/ATP-dependent DNA helicase PcrA
MDKRLILAVAGSGKTTHILNQLDTGARHLIVTYTRENIRNLHNGIVRKFGYFPQNIKLFSFFEFLYSFCYRPFLDRIDNPNGLFWERPPHFTSRIPTHARPHVFTKDGRIYHNRLSKYLFHCSLEDQINQRIEKYFDHFHIDEIQDFAGYDFDFIEHFAKLNIGLNWVGDFYQHSFDTSRDGVKNKNLHSDYNNYLSRFTDLGISIDQTTLMKSRRCPKVITNFITDQLGVEIDSHKEDEATVEFVDEAERVNQLASDMSIVKLFYQNHNKYKCYSNNWGKVKGADHFKDVCVVLNKTSLKSFKDGTLIESAPSTRNKLYVAMSRANRNLYLIPEPLLANHKKETTNGL